nr:unnamed protein product [Callosobruchus analis]
MLWFAVSSICIQLTACLQNPYNASLHYQSSVISKTRTSIIHRYGTYRDITLIHLYIPQHTLFASFKFTGDETRMSIFACKPRDVSLYMKHGAPPVINPDGSKFPKDFKHITRSDLYHIEFMTDNKEQYINVTSPYPGWYYVAVFLSYVNPEFSPITQQGLSPSCYANVEALLYVEKISNPLIFTENNLMEVQSTANSSRFFKTYISDDYDHALIQVETLNFAPNIESMKIRINIDRPPSQNVFVTEKRFYANSSDKSVSFWTIPGSWHFIEIIFEGNKENSSVPSKAMFKLKRLSNLIVNPDEYEFLSNEEFFNNSVTKVYRNRSIDTLIPYKQYNLVRDALSETFTFSYVLDSELQYNTILPVNMTNEHFSSLKFDIRDGTETGGTLQFIMAFKPRLKQKDKLITFESEPKTNIIIACLSRDTMELPVWPNKCVTRNSERMSELVLNSTVENSTILVPYPEVGTWYATFKLFCQNCTPCDCPERCQSSFKACVDACELSCDISCQDCATNCSKSLIETEECKGCDCDGPCLRDRTSSCNSSIIYDISSRPCVSGQCSPNGICKFMVSDGVVFSTCYCMNKYRGWDCSDGSLATPFYMLVIELLLLVLSNLAFIPAVYVAFKRKYYVESIAYFSICFFSTFYHSCDAGENIISFCLTKANALQFGDFFCALLAIWVTLLAMADLPQMWTSIAQMAGAISLAFCTSIDRMALWLFVVPVAIGIIIVSASWYAKYKKVKHSFVNRRYLRVELPVGSAMVAVGLILFAFLQTKNNYKYLHSLWHVIMAFSIVMLLPKPKTFLSEALI